MCIYKINVIFYLYKHISKIWHVLNIHIYIFRIINDNLKMTSKIEEVYILCHNHSILFHQINFDTFLQGIIHRCACAYYSTFW